MSGKRKKRTLHTDAEGYYVWESFFVRGKQRRAKRRVMVIDGEIIDDPETWLLMNADDSTLHAAERWDLIGRRMMEKEQEKNASPMKTPRILKLRIEELEQAFDWLDEAARMNYDDGPTLSFLDLATGEIFTPEEEDETEDCCGTQTLLPLPNDLFEDLHWGLLDDFVQTLGNHPARGRLVHAIRGKGAFRRFREIVCHGGDVELNHRWRWFETCEKRSRIVKWLKDENIEPVWDYDIFQAPPMPSKRTDLLLIVAEFVEAASKLPGILRIALIGSLVTDKAIPKDVDILVGVEDDMPLDELARLSRRANGKTMATGDCCGTEVFLHNAHGEYLGRVCRWKDCAPGIRLACQAQDCGRRHFLNNDLQKLRLDSNLIQSPPLVLWPEAAAHAELPDDVRVLIAR